LIERGVSVTISYLLFRNTINEIYGACKYWKRKGASALILRPLTGPQGKSPELGYSQVEKEIIKKVVKDNTDFVFVQPWFQNWLNGAKPPTIEHKEYATCYSGYYRIAISPYRSTRTSHRVTVDDVDMNMANSAWITLCTYRHYDASYGCEYPNNLKDWLHNDREVALARINPSFQCDGIICCRHEPNRRIFEQISIAGSK
jgi:hypothetical protein